MRRKSIVLLSLTLLLFATDLVAQISVSSTRKALYNKRTASWCGPCGEWGDLVDGNIVHNADNKAVIFKLTSSSTGALYSPVCAQLFDHYDTRGHDAYPNFYVNAVNRTEYTPFGISTSTTRLNCSNKIASFYRETGADVNAGFIVNQTADSIIVDVTTEFFSELTGDFFTGVYVLEDSITYLQKVTGSGNVSTTANHFMRASLAGSTVFGQPVGSGTVPAGTKVNGHFSTAINPSWKPADLHVITVVWKADTGDVYRVLNSNDVASLATGLNLKETVSKLSIYPNPTTDILNITTTGKTDQSVVIFDLYGTRVLSLSGPITEKGTIDISSLNPGVYFIRLYKAEQCVATKKFVKQ